MLGQLKRIRERHGATDYLRAHSSTLIVYTSILTYSVLFSILSILKHSEYGTAAWDLGIFNQALWTTSKSGAFFYYTVEQYIIPSGNFFGIHFSPILLVVLPIYALVPAPETLLVIQSSLLAMSAVPVYLLARKELSDNVSGAFIAVAYLSYPLLQGVNWFDFHVEAFLPLFLILSFYYLANENWLKYFLVIFLTLCVMEQAAVIVSFMGLYYLVAWRSWLVKNLQTRTLTSWKGVIPMILIMLGVGWYVVQAWIKAEFFPVNPAFLSVYKAISHWSVLGVRSDPIQIPLYILLDPSRALRALSYDGTLKIVYLLLAFAPLLFLSLRNSRLLMSLAWLGPALLSNFSPYYVIGYQYSAFIIPFILVAAIYGLKSLAIQGKFPQIRLRKISRNILIVSVLFSLLVSPYSPIGQALKGGNVFFFLPAPVPLGSHASLLDKFVALIPQNASVLTQNNIFPHLSSRANAYVSPAGLFGPLQEYAQYLDGMLQKSDYVLVDTSVGYSDPSSPITLDNALKTGVFGLYAYADGIFLLKRNYTAQPIFNLRQQTVYNFKTLSLNSGEILKDPTSSSGSVLFHNSGDQPNFWFGPYAALSAGNYEATFRLKVSSSGAGKLLTIEATAFGGQLMLASQDINFSDIASYNTWQNFTLNFSLSRPVTYAEFTGINAAVSSSIMLDYIQLKPV